MEFKGRICLHISWLLKRGFSLTLSVRLMLNLFLLFLSMISCFLLWLGVKDDIWLGGNDGSALLVGLALRDWMSNGISFRFLLVLLSILVRVLRYRIMEWSLRCTYQRLNLPHRNLYECMEKVVRWYQFQLLCLSLIQCIFHWDSLNFISYSNQCLVCLLIYNVILIRFWSFFVLKK
jgi:hypothetical protein